MAPAPCLPTIKLGITIVPSQILTNKKWVGKGVTGFPLGGITNARLLKANWYNGSMSWATVKIIAGGCFVLVGVVTYSVDIIPAGLPSLYGFLPLLLGLAGTGLITWSFIDLRGQISDLRQEVKRLNDLRPTITTEPVRVGDAYCLKVTNHGGPAVFTAQITVQADDRAATGTTSSTRYTGLWDSPDRGSAEMVNGDSVLIRIAESRLISLGVAMQSMNLLFYKPGNYPESGPNPAYPSTATSQGHGSVTRPVKPDEELRLLVEITSHPQLREGRYRQLFRLGRGGLSASRSGTAGTGPSLKANGAL